MGDAEASHADTVTRMETFAQYLTGFAVLQADDLFPDAKLRDILRLAESRGRGGTLDELEWATTMEQRVRLRKWVQKHGVGWGPRDEEGGQESRREAGAGKEDASGNEAGVWMDGGPGGKRLKIVPVSQIADVLARACRSAKGAEEVLHEVRHGAG